MPIHSEHMSAHAGITHAGPFSIVDGDLLSATQHAVILSSDDVVVIRGSLADLRTFHARLGALLEAEPEHVCGDDDECETCDPRCPECGSTTSPAPDDETVRVCDDECEGQDG